MHITEGIKFVQQTWSNPLHFQGMLKKPISALKSKAIMDLRTLCVCVSVRRPVCSIRAAEYLKHLRCPFISPEYHVGGADPRAWHSSFT